MGERMTEIHESIKHIFEGQTQFRREMEQVKIDILGKVSKQELETQLLLKANKQSVANALQRKANKIDMEPLQKQLKSIDQAMMLTTGSGTIHDKINEMSRMLEDTKTSMDLRLDERLSRKVNEMEDNYKKYMNRDIQRINGELLNLNSSFSKICLEQKGMEEKIKTKLFTTKSVQKQLTEMGGKNQADEILKDSHMQLKIDSGVNQRLRNLGLATDDMPRFRDSLQKLMYEHNPTHLISSSNKEIP